MPWKRPMTRRQGAWLKGAALLLLGSLPALLAADQEGILEEAPARIEAGKPKSDHPVPPWRFSFSAEWRYMEGDFETGRTIKISQYSATLRARHDRFDLSVTPTYLETETTGTGSVVSSSGGSPFFQERGGPGRARRGDALQEEEGLGDTFVEAGFLAGRQEDAGIDLRLSAGVKLPTADEDKGLGTGETDSFAHAELTRWQGDYVGAFRFGKTFMGDTRTTEFRDPWDAAVGFGRRFSLDGDRALEPRLWLRGREAPIRGASDPVELAATLDYDLKKTFFTFELAGGLSDGAPDYTVALGVGFDF